VKTPTIGVVISTPGRQSILRTLNSIRYQGLIPGDDIIIVADGHHQPTQDIVEMYGPPFRYVATTRTRDWGHSQVNYGIQNVGGDWVIIQDDDDIFLPRAFDEIRAITAKLDSPRPLIGRVMTPYLGILWTAPGKEPLDGHCLVVPNDKKRIGYFGLEYAGDQKWLQSNLDAYDVYSWADRVWTLTRPTGKLWPRLWYYSHDADGAPVRCGWTFHRDEDGVAALDYCLALRMVRDGDVWKGSIHVEGGRDDLSGAEAKEVLEFAAWAGQGCDVWMKIPLGPWMAVANEAGYQMHQVTTEWAEFTFDWPPHKFEPPKRQA
jgi:glycosyltransferase involved in cell wall biosynthesis